MAIKLNVTGSQSVTLNEPTRNMFANNLGGAVEFSLTHLIYSILGVMGDVIGEFLGGVAIRFMERVEPSLVEIVNPFLDMLLGAPDLSSEMKAFLTGLKTPKHEAELGILAGIADGVAKAAPDSLFQSLGRPLDRWIASRFQNERPDIQTIWAMMMRGYLDGPTFRKWGHDLGYDDNLLNGFAALYTARPDVSTLLEAMRRGFTTSTEVIAELEKHGFLLNDAGMYVKLSEHLASTNEILQFYTRGQISLDDAQARLKLLGYNQADAFKLAAFSPSTPSIGDGVKLGVFDVFSDTLSNRYGLDGELPSFLADVFVKMGFGPDYAKRYWRAHWNMPSASVAADMLQKGIISQTDYTTLLQLNEIPPYFRTKLQQASYNNFSRIDIRRMYKEGFLTLDQVTKGYIKLGYTAEDASLMAKFTDKIEFPDPDTKPAKYRELTAGLLETAYVKNLIGLEEYKAQLLKINYPADEIDLIVSVADLKKHVNQAPDYITEYQTEIKSLVERSYSSGILDEPTARSTLNAAGYVPAEIDFIIKSQDYNLEESERNKQIKILSTAYSNRTISKVDLIAELGKLEVTGIQQAQIIDDLDLDLQFNARRLTETEYAKAWKLGYITEDEFRADITALGYSDYDVDLLMLLDAPPPPKSVRIAPTPPPSPQPIQIA
jgi:hypothetical protein